MTILAVGCSHTYGDDLVDKSAAWPHMLASLMDTNAINAAVSGGTNELIIHEVLKQTVNQNYDLVAIAWTYANRRTFWTTDTMHPVNFNIHLAHDLYGNESYFQQFGKLLYAHWMNDLQSIKSWLQQILMLQSWLICMEQNYVMLNATDNGLANYLENDWSKFDFFHRMDDEQIASEKHEIQGYIDLIDKSNYYNLLDYAIIEQKFKTGRTGHLLEEGHADTAKRIYEFICSR